MPRLLIVNRAQAPYYKALYTALADELGEDWEVMLQTLDKQWEGFAGHRFRRDLIIPSGVAVRQYRAGRLPGLGRGRRWLSTAGRGRAENQKRG